MVRVLDCQSRSSKFNTIGWLQGRFSVSSFPGWLQGTPRDEVVKNKLPLHRRSAVLIEAVKPYPEKGTIKF